VFQTGDLAGYWVPKRFAVHGVLRDGFPGERIWAQVKVFNDSGQLQRGSSQPFSLDLEPLTTLQGLRSFRLQNPPPAIDFRNLVPGVVDAPVYDVDGKTKLDDRFFATLLAAPVLVEQTGPQGLMPIGVGAPFSKGDLAGYFTGPANAVPWASPGQRVWIVVRVYESVPTNWGPESIPPVLWGESKPFIVELRDSPVSLLGLESFRLNLQDCRMALAADHLVVTWPSLYPAVMNYSLLVASSAQPETWTRVFQGAATPQTYAPMSVTYPIYSPQVFFRLQMTRAVQ